MLRYAERVYGVKQIIEGIRDLREAARIRTGRVVTATLVMRLARLGSLNRLEQSRRNAYWRKWLGGRLPGADTMGRVVARLDCSGLRAGLRQIYHRQKRNKGIHGWEGGLIALVIDGHECATSDLREWPGCLQRQITTPQRTYSQSYQRMVVASLVFQGRCLLLDAELQRPGEDEVAAATRLFERVVETYPRAFQVVVADGLYLRSDFFHRVLDKGKEVIAVVKDERRELLVDARSLFHDVEPMTLCRRHTQCTCWDMDQLTSWESLGRGVRLVRSLETTRVRRQRTRQEEHQTSEWIWATTLSPQAASTPTIVQLGHSRWSIENEGGFNELVNRWGADHVYKHHANAILACWLLAMLVYNLFHAFYLFNLKPALRLRLRMAYCLSLISADFYNRDVLFQQHPP